NYQGVDRLPAYDPSGGENGDSGHGPDGGHNPVLKESSNEGFNDRISGSNPTGCINPVHFAHQICDEFLRYIFSAFPLSDPELARQARRLPEPPSPPGTPLVQGPFVSRPEGFAKGEPVQVMSDRGMLHPIMPGLIGYPSMWLHQEQVFQAVKDGRHVL